jgi:hypothetical protein
VLQIILAMLVRWLGRPTRRWLVLLVSLLLACSAHAQAQDLSPFLDLERPGHLTLRLFATGYGAEKYGTTHQAFELDQSLTRAVSVVGRVLAYQIYQGTGFDSPLKPAARNATHDFGRFEGGIRLSPFQGTTFALLGGKDVGDSDAAVFENDFSSWLWLQSRHPVNVAYSSNHYYENGVTNGLIDVRTVALSTSRLILLLGAGGAIWGGGSVGQAKGQGGPDIGLLLRGWHVSVDVQAGYGSSRTYGMVSISRSFDWEE